MVYPFSWVKTLKPFKGKLYMKMFITEAQAEQLRNIKAQGGSQRKRAKMAVFAQIKRDHKLPFNARIAFWIENPDNPLYRVIRDRRSKLPLDNGVPEPVEQPAVAISPAGKIASEAPEAGVKIGKKTAAPKAAAAPATKKVPALAAPAPVKKAAAKAAAKTDATDAKIKPAAKKVAAKPLKAAAKTVPAKKAIAKPAAKAVAKKAVVKTAVQKKATAKA